MNQQIFTQGYALIVGVGADLKCTVDDANGLAEILKDEERCAYPARQVQLLTETKANRTGILTALDELAKTTEQDATVVIYFSGHGYIQGTSYYLIPHDCTKQNFPDTAITGAEFAAKIVAIPAKKKVILLDCCYAGGVGDVKNFGLSKSSLPSDAVDLFKQGSGYVIIASSTEDEKSRTGKPYSVFTAVLIEALCGKGVAKKDGYVRVADLAGHTRERVPRLTGNKQHPVLHFEQADNFVIAYYAAGEEQPKSLPFELNAESDTTTTLKQSVKNIEDLFVRARHDQAYTQFHQLCHDYPDYQTQASMICTRYQDFENQVISGILPMSQQNTAKLEIAAAFQTCLKKFKQEYLANE
jgi:hypothetical protein